LDAWRHFPLGDEGFEGECAAEKEHYYFQKQMIFTDTSLLCPETPSMQVAFVLRYSS